LKLLRSIFVLIPILFVGFGVSLNSNLVYAAFEPIDTSPVEVSVLDDSQDLTRLQISVDEFTLTEVELETGNYDLITVGMEETISKDGWPDLPFIARSVLIPPQSDVRIQINGIESHIETGLNPVICPREVGEEFVQVGEAEGYQIQDGFWPPSPVELGSPAIIRGYRLINIRYYPLQYNRNSGEMRYNENIDFSMIYEGVGENIVTRPEPPRSSIYFYRALDQIVENPPPHPNRDDLHSASYLYILPDANGVGAAMEPLIEWQKRKGHRVAVSTLDNRAGVGAVQNVIRDHYAANDPVELVALVGDAIGGIALSAASQFGDYNYTRLDGNDPLPDVALGRISCTSLNELNTIVNKLVSYESDPYMEDTDWFKQGAVVAGHIGNGLGTVLVAKYVRRELLKLGYDEVHHWYHNEDGEIRGNQEFITNNFSWGVSVFHYRAYASMNNLNIGIVYNLPNTRGRWPAVLAISCNTGNFVAQDAYSEAFLKSRGGGIGCISTATPQTNVRFNNLMAGGVWKGIYKDKLYTMGWGLNSGKYQLWRSYQGFDGQYLSFMDWNNLMGDPGTVIWTDIPTIIEVDHQEEFQLGSNSFTVDVFREEDEESVGEALVCLYKADDDFQISKYTDSNGMVNFYIDPDAISEGELMITVSKHNHKPYLEEIEVVNPEDFVGISEWEIDDDAEGDSDGDDDGRVNPCETIEITTTFTNFSEQDPEGAGQISFESLTPYLEVISDPVDIDQCPAGGESIEVVAVVQVNPACPDDVDGLISATISAGDLEWESFLNLDVRAPEIVVVEYDFHGRTFEPGDVDLVDITLQNTGNKLLQESTVTLVIENSLLDVVRETVDYRIIARNRTIEDGPFRIAAHPFTIPGVVVPAYLVIEAEGGFIDTAHFSIEVEGRDIGDPLGPDEYGYICLDSGDEEWEYCPEYNWEEIDPDEDDFAFRGTVIQLRDSGDNQDVSAVRDLPFEFQYYGEVFDEITICSNGWAALGDQSDLADFRNRRIGQALGPDAQLCVWWDNLIIPNNAAVLHHYDDEGGRYIIEWNNVQRLVNGGNGARETFQIILYDPAVHDTDTGDGIILFQYKEVTNQNAVARNDHPYCTIGISNLDDSDGIEYTYWNRYPTGARQIQNRMALLFITESDFRTGVLTGQITDVETGEPVTNAEIFTSRGFWGETDEEGIYVIDNILAKEDYEVTAVALGWNDSTLTGFDIVEDEILRVDFSLLHPEFVPSQEEFEQQLVVGDDTEIDFELTNTGNGPLTWTVDRELIDENEMDPWQIRRQYQAGQILNDSRIQGAVFFDEHYFIAGANNLNPQIYVLDREGELVEQFDQPGESRYGMKDLAYDGELIWGSGENTIFGISPEGEVVTEFRGPFNPNNNFAWDPDRGVLWVSSTTSDIVAMDQEGNEIEQLDRKRLRIYGLVYWSDDPDGYPLYLIHKNTDIADMIVHKMNPDNGDTLFVSILEPEGEGTPSAGFITNEYDVYNWVFGVIANSGPNDRIDIWQLAARRDWFGIDPRTGALDPDESQELTLTLNANNMPAVEFRGDLVFTHNAMNGETRLPVTLEIIEEERPEVRTLNLVQGWNLASLNITPEVQEIIPLMEPLTEGGLLTLMKDGQGRFYLPEREFCNIPGWNPLGGYQIYVEEDAQLQVQGEIIAGDEPIPLTEGWNMSAYLPREAVDAEISLQNIRDQLLIAKDGIGRFYLPEFGFSNMGNLAEGYGYQYKVSEDVELIYTVEDVVAFESYGLVSTKHYPMPVPKSVNMSVLVLSEICVEKGTDISNWELGIFSEQDIILGAGRFDATGRCGVAVWGDDPATKAIDGAGVGTALRFRLWNGESESDIYLNHISGEAIWSPDGLFIGELNEQSLMPLEFGINATYPNPFNGQVKIEYSIVESGRTSLKILDISGREIEKLISEVKTEGKYILTWEAHNMPSGLYFVKMNQNRKTISKKLMLVK